MGKISPSVRRIRQRKKQYQRQDVRVEVPADTNRLYGSLRQAADYLAELAVQYAGQPTASLEEAWDGHETMRMVVSYYRPETGAEYLYRLREERRRHQYQQQEQEREQKRRRELEEYHRLGARLGLRSRW